MNDEQIPDWVKAYAVATTKRPLRAWENKDWLVYKTIRKTVTYHYDPANIAVDDMTRYRGQGYVWVATKDALHQPKTLREAW